MLSEEDVLDLEEVLLKIDKRRHRSKRGKLADPNRTG
jgi:hypothetical protein